MYINLQINFTAMSTVTIFLIQCLKVLFIYRWIYLTKITITKLWFFGFLFILFYCLLLSNKYWRTVSCWWTFINFLSIKTEGEISFKHFRCSRDVKELITTLYSKQQGCQGPRCFILHPIPGNSFRFKV